jgi:hypothetical protein
VIKPPMRIYLSGPMSGIAESNFPAFRLWASSLRALGFVVVNPAEINVGAEERVGGSPEEMSAFYNQCMRADIRELCTCEAIVLMPGWENSKGANLELHIAHRVGLHVGLAGDVFIRATT